jgi:hypothetical protein
MQKGIGGSHCTLMWTNAALVEDRVLSEVLRAEGNMTDLSIDRFKIFICYRRSDSAATAGRLRDLLARSLGIDSVFIGR